MFYNVAAEAARWRIGWAAFNRDCNKVVDRSVEDTLVSTLAEAI